MSKLYALFALAAIIGLWGCDSSTKPPVNSEASKMAIESQPAAGEKVESPGAAASGSTVTQAIKIDLVIMTSCNKPLHRSRIE